MDKLDIRKTFLPDLSAERNLKQAQDSLKEMARREKMVKPTGILAEIDEHRNCNND